MIFQAIEYAQEILVAKLYALLWITDYYLFIDAFVLWLLNKISLKDAFPICQWSQTDCTSASVGEVLYCS